jgi:probable rRNA maturation factor
MSRGNDAICVSIDRATGCVPLGPARLRELVAAVLRRFRIRRASVDLIIADNAGMCRVNRRYFSSSAVTDCISFDLTDRLDDRRSFSIIVNAELAKRQAKLRGHSARAELALYIVHGLLHQLGFDDLTSKDAERMHLEEDRILQQAGYGRVYHQDSDPIRQNRRSRRPA